MIKLLIVHFICYLLVTLKFLANDSLRESEDMYFAYTRYFVPATLPNFLFTFLLHYWIFNLLFLCQWRFCFSVCYGIHFPSGRVCEFMLQNYSYRGKVVCSICAFAGKLIRCIRQYLKLFAHDQTLAHKTKIDKAIANFFPKNNFLTTTQ
jgi:hypothetical protein